MFPVQDTIVVVVEDRHGNRSVDEPLGVSLDSEREDLESLTVDGRDDDRNQQPIEIGQSGQEIP